MLETGVLIDNSAGVYAADEIVLRLADELAAMTGRNDYAGDFGIEFDSCDPEDRAQYAHDIEEEIIDKINDELRDHGLVLVLGEVESGVYIVEEMEED